MTAATVLENAALAAERDPLKPGPGQFVKSERTGTAEGGGSFRRTVWAPADGGSAGLVRLERGGEVAWLVPPGPECLEGHVAGLRDKLAELPTDVPEQVLERLYSPEQPGKASTADHERAWGRARWLAGRAYLPAKQRAALYRAITRIGGVSVEAGVKDAKGRVGNAVTFTTTDGRKE